MNAKTKLAVTLSAELLRHLRAESRRLDVPFEWLVAGLVADTFEGADLTPMACAVSA